MADEEVAAEAVAEVTEAPKVEAEQPELPLADAAPAKEVKPEARAEEAEAPKPDEPKAEEPKPDWKDKELKKKHAQIMEARRQLEAANAEIQRLSATQPEPAPVAPGQPITQANGKPVAAEVEIAAQRLLDQRSYQSNLDKADKSGTEAYGEEWKTAIENLTLKGGFVESPDTMRLILATAKKFGDGAPAKILYELGNDPNKFDALMALPFDERVFEMAELAKAPAQPKKLSAAPAPVAAIGGRATPVPKTLSEISENAADDDKWYAIRQVDKRKKWERANGIRR